MVSLLRMLLRGPYLFMTTQWSLIKSDENLLVAWWNESGFPKSFIPFFFRYLPPESMPVDNEEIMSALLYINGFKVPRIVKDQPDLYDDDDYVLRRRLL